MAEPVKVKRQLSQQQIENLIKARELATIARKERTETKKNEKLLKQLAWEEKKEIVKKGMDELNKKLVPEQSSIQPPITPPKSIPEPVLEVPKQKKKKIVYVEESSSEEEIEYVKRVHKPKPPPKMKPRSPSPPPIEEQMSRFSMQDNLTRLKREHLMSQMFGGRY